MIRFGVHAGPQECPVAELVQLWAAAERLGFEWISIWDHFYPAQVAPDRDCLEAVACHALLAAKTRAVRVGSLVYCAGYRHPAVLANAAATIDHISGGRLELGLGAGWHEAEYRAYGIPFEAPAVRLRRLAEAVEIIRLLWSEPVADFKGEFFTLTGAMCHPKPVQQSPRIWIGATGERLALPLAGRIADGWNAAYVSPESFARKLAIIKASSPAPDRLVTGVNVGLVLSDGDPQDALRRRYGDAADAVRPGILHGSIGEIVDRVGRYREAGADWLNLGLRAPFELDALQRFAAEVMPEARALA